MPVELGVNTTNSGDQHRIDADLDLAVTLGFTWVRTSQEMHWGGGSTGAYALGVLERYARAAHDRGLRLVQCCQGMPASLARGGRAGHYGPKNASAATAWGTWFAECCARVAVANGVTSCLNEPDNYGWDTTPSATDCAALHVAGFQARDRIAPDAIVATAEMAPGLNPEPLTFLQAILRACGSYDPLDEQNVLVGWHPYTDPRWPADYNATWNTCHKMRTVHDFLVDDGHPRMKILGGEWGVATGPSNWGQALSPQKAADYVRTQYLPTFDRMRADGVRLGPMCWYALRDGQAGDGSWADFCGVVDRQGNPKPVAAVFEAFNTGG